MSSFLRNESGRILGRTLKGRRDGKATLVLSKYTEVTKHTFPQNIYLMVVLIFLSLPCVELNSGMTKIRDTETAAVFVVQM